MALRLAILVVVKTSLPMSMANANFVRARCDGMLGGKKKTFLNSVNNFTLVEYVLANDSFIHSQRKMQALYGNAMAMFLADTLLEAIDDLVDSNITNQTEILTRLQKDEDDDFELLSKRKVPVTVEYDKIPLDKDLLNHANASVFFRSPSVCHIAKLPSQSRYLGILTETNETGVHGYYSGIHMDDAMKLTSRQNGDAPSMPLVWDSEEREKECPLEIQRDFKDYFFVSSKMGSAMLTIPNAAEMKAYGRKSQKLHGILVLCLIQCPWGKCPKDAARQEEIKNGKVRLEVNDQRVTNVTAMGGECLVLGNDKSHRFQANDAGQFVLRANILANNAILRISSLIVL
jgi:hypothetical protein